MNSLISNFSNNISQKFCTIYPEHIYDYILYNNLANNNLIWKKSIHIV
jgi:hypothetical protein